MNGYKALMNAKNRKNLKNINLKQLVNSFTDEQITEITTLLCEKRIYPVVNGIPDNLVDEFASYLAMRYE